MDAKIHIPLTVIASLILGAAVLLAAGAGTKPLLLLVAALGAGTGVFLYPDRGRLFTVLFVITIPFNVYKHFGDFTPGGPNGLIWHGGLRSLRYISINELLIIALSFVAFARAAVDRRRFVARREDAVFLFFFLAALVSILASPAALEFGVRRIRELATFMLVYCYFSRTFDWEKHVGPVTAACGVILLVEVLVSVGQLFGVVIEFFAIFGANSASNAIGFYTSNIRRVFGTFSGPNPLSCFLVMLLPLVLAGGFLGASRLRRTIHLFLYAGGVAVIFFTLSRGAWAGVLVQIAVLLLLGRGSLPRWVYSGWLWAGVSAMLGGLVVSQLDAIIFRLFSHESAEAGLSRLSQFKVAWYYFSHHPLCGVGLGNYLTELFTVDRLLNVNSYGLMVHNMYLKVLAETGLLGLAGYLGMYLQSLRRLYDRLRRGGEQGIFALCLIMSLAGHMVHNFVELAELEYIMSTFLYFTFAIGCVRDGESAEPPYDTGGAA